MPNQPKTPLIAVRVPQERQDRLKRVAEREGKTVSALVNEAIETLLTSRG